MSSTCCNTDKKEHNHVWYTSFFGHKTELIFAILAGVFYFTGLFLDHVVSVDIFWVNLVYGISLFFGGYFLLIEHGGDILRGNLNIDFLMLAAAAGAVYIDRWAEAALLLFLFSLGHALEHFALDKARRNIEKLGELSPKTALLKKNNEWIEIPVEELKINDIILVRPNSKIAADGVIIAGNSSIDQSSITGESMPVDKTAISTPESEISFDNLENVNKVFTGSINGDNALQVKVLKLNKDSTIARMVEMVSQLDDKKSETQLFTQKFEKWYVPAVIAFVVLLCFAFLVLNETFRESLYRAITVLVAASPCALAISTPSAVLSGVARAARSGVLIKGGKALENLGEITTVAFDKTGTLTEGKPKLTHLIPLDGFDETEFAKMTAEVEELSNHPLAKAISAGITEKYGDLTENEASEIQGVQGMGITANYKGKKVFIGNEKLMETHGIAFTDEQKSRFNQLLNEGNTTMLVATDSKPAGIIAVMDLPRKTAADTLIRLKEIGIKNMIMLTGDHQLIGENIARQIGLTEAKGDLLPEDKVDAISDLNQKYGKVAMVGDGVNDAPAMANASVGVAMGAAGSDVALETADVALMSDKIERLPFVIGLSRASKRIIRQNIWISMGMVALLVPLTLFGVASIGPAVIMHEGSTLLVVLNALRLLAYKDNS
ncbi:MAG: heavy metal translocating P-type ATPase [Flavobacteriaceae bacterium]|nr:heavy metal translocating P-type ATPase [Flavobacteriaceae bacterium]